VVRGGKWYLKEKGENRKRTSGGPRTGSNGSANATKSLFQTKRGVKRESDNENRNGAALASRRVSVEKEKGVL